MNRYEFMRQLEMLLSDITPSERDEALQFYNDYFDDAGVENELDVIKALGSPAKVAATIKADLTGNETGEFTETGYQDFYNKGQEIVAYGQVADDQNQGNTYQNGTYQGGTKYNTYQNGQGNTYQNAGSDGKRGRNGGQIALIIVLFIFAAPILIPIAATFFAILVAIAAVLFALFVGVAAVAFAMVVTGIVLLVVGIIKMFAAPFGGLCLAGTGLVCGGIGILFVILSVWICAIIVPAVVKGMVNLCRMPFKRKRGTTV